MVVIQRGFVLAPLPIAGRIWFGVLPSSEKSYSSVFLIDCVYFEGSFFSEKKNYFLFF